MIRTTSVENPCQVSLSLPPQQSQFLRLQDWLVPLSKENIDSTLFTPRVGIRSKIETSVDDNGILCRRVTLQNKNGCKIIYTEYSDLDGITYTKVRIGN